MRSDLSVDQAAIAQSDAEPQTLRDAAENLLMIDFLLGFATCVFLLVLWKWIKWELSGNWL
jgi:hypothetical protein